METRLQGDVTFDIYRSAFVNAIRKTLESNPLRSLDEAAFPAYSHPNKIINWVYWTRLRSVMKAIRQFGRICTAFDFGCGSGVLLPFLGQRADKVIGADLDLAPVKQIQDHIKFPENISFVDLNVHPLETLETESVDLITALNVLEHLEESEKTIDILYGMLKPGGIMVVSLPKENKIYNLARKIAGKEFTGDYHETTYSDVERYCRQKGPLTDIVKHFPFNLVFRIFYLNKE